ncbi:unnamed protein product [Alopecurus aequalis]
MRPSSMTPRDLEHILSDETAEPKPLSLSLLQEITDDFSDEQRIGIGGFAVVYKGKLPNRTVAVKRMSDACMDETVFHREVQCLMMAKHTNIVRFLGYCADRQGIMDQYEGKLVMADVHQRLLCFEYLPKGSLHEYITDLKPANILLDNNLVAKIADFGLSRCFGETQSRIITLNIGGTFGYLPPEFGNGEITYQLDIFSLGVIIMELLTGKKGYHDVDKVVESWTKSLEKSHREVQQEQVRVCAEIGIECIDSNPAKRPNMQHIVDRLDKTKIVDGYIETGVITSQQFIQKDLIFNVNSEQGYELKQLRELNLHGSLKISGLGNVTSREEAVEANLASNEQLTELKLEWDYLGWDYPGSRCSPEVEADVLEGLCPPVGLKKLKIVGYKGSRYPDWMMGKADGGPKDLQDFYLYTRIERPAPQIVEAFPHLRVLWLAGGTQDALPSNMEHLTSLKELHIGKNRNIQSLPTLPRSLEEFHLYHCDPKFTKSCLTVGHPNWQKIEHVPKKTFDELTNRDRMQLGLGNIWRGMTM